MRFSGGWAAFAGGIPKTFRETSSPAESIRFSDGSGAPRGVLLGKFLEMSLRLDL